MGLKLQIAQTKTQNVHIGQKQIAKLLLNDRMMNHSKTNYTLNMDKTWKRKLGACKAECKVRTEFKGGNYVFEFSAAMYELYRTALVEHFETVKDDTSATIKILYEYKDCSDQSGVSVDFWVKI